MLEGFDLFKGINSDLGIHNKNVASFSKNWIFSIEMFDVVESTDSYTDDRAVRWDGYCWCHEALGMSSDRY